VPTEFKLVIAKILQEKITPTYLMNKLEQSERDFLIKSVAVGLSSNEDYEIR
jgi:hypothetical protein